MSGGAAGRSVNHGAVVLLAVAAAAAAMAPCAACVTLNLTGAVPDNGSPYFNLSFAVPPGTAEIEVAHSAASSENILDFGLWSPTGFRGWGGGNGEPAVVNALAASRSYLPGPVEAGRWAVVVGKAQLAVLPGHYSVAVTLRNATTLPPQPDRGPFVPQPPISNETRWYAGDFHVHSRQSGDANDSLDALAEFAAARGLDFVHVSDHNTYAAATLMTAAQGRVLRYAPLLLMSGQELTTYRGHVGCLGCSSFVDWRVGAAGVTAESMALAARRAGGLLVANHVDLYEDAGLRNKCVGCAYNLAIPPELLDAVEVGVQGYDGYGWALDPRAIDFWDGLCAQGYRVAALGGSDDHRGGADAWPKSRVGSPTTMVLAGGLSSSAVLAAVRAGRTAVKLRGPGDPLPAMSFSPPPDANSTVRGAANMTATVTGAGAGGVVLRVVRNGGLLAEHNVTGDPFVVSRTVSPPSAGEDRYRLQLYCGGTPCAITSHVWVS